MKIMFTSDTHGSVYYCRGMLDICGGAGAGRLVSLGDILYHGPHNNLPRDYMPKGVITMLNPVKSEIYTVRGDCDTEVDRMVLGFPIMADYGLFVIKGGTFYTTCGHVFDQDHLPPMKEGDILVYGYTHLLKTETADSIPCGRVTVFDPGSASVPKGRDPHIYAMLVDGVFRILTLDGNLVKEMRL